VELKFVAYLMNFFPLVSRVYPCERKSEFNRKITLVFYMSLGPFALMVFLLCFLSLSLSLSLFTGIHSTVGKGKARAWLIVLKL